MNQSAAEYVIKRADELDQMDSGWRSHMASIAEVIRPLRRELRGGKRQEGDRRMGEVFDGTAINAARNLSSGLYGTASNPAESWFSLSLIDEDAAKWGPNRDWLARQSRRMLASFGASYSAFYAQLPSFYLDLAAFGTAIFSSELRKDHSGFVDLSRSLSSHNFDCDGEGNANAMYVRRCLTIANAIAEYGLEKLSDRLRAKVPQKVNETADFVEAVMPNPDYQRGMLGTPGKPFVKLVVEVETKHEVLREGFWEFPYQVACWEKADGERKGRGPGEQALPDTKSLNVMVKGNLKAGEMAAQPPWGATDEGNMSVVRLAPNKITYGAIDRNGNQLLKPLITGGTTPFSLEMANQLRSAIKDYFFFSLMQLEGRTGMTSIEWIEYNEQKMRLMAPYLGHIQSDFLAKIVMRRLTLLNLVPGALEPPPPDMEGHTLMPKFTSAAALAQKSARGAGVLRFYQAKTMIVAGNPRAAARVNDDKALEIAAEAFALPELINDDETTAANREAIQRTLQMQQAAQTVPPLAGAAKDGADAIASLRDGGKQAA